MFGAGVLLADDAGKIERGANAAAQNEKSHNADNDQHHFVGLFLGGLCGLAAFLAACFGIGGRLFLFLVCFFFFVFFRHDGTPYAPSSVRQAPTSCRKAGIRPFPVLATIWLTRG